MAVSNSKGKGAKNPLKTLNRLLKYTFSHYKVATVFVVIFVILASASNVVGASRLAPITSELMNGAAADMKSVYMNVLAMGCIYLVGVLSSFGYNRIMMYIAQGTLDRKSVV